MKRKNSILAMAVATTVAFGAITVVPTVQQSLPFAAAAASDVAPGKYYVKPAADAEQYMDQMKRYLAVAMARQLYFAAANNQFMDKAAGDEKDHASDVFFRSEGASGLAKARLALSILAVEGGAEARTIDIAQVGIERDSSALALGVLHKAITQSEAQAAGVAAESEEGKQLERRLAIFKEGMSRLGDVLADFGAGTGFEASPWQVVNYGVDSTYVAQAKQDVATDPNFTPVVTSVNVASPVAADKSLLIANGKQNLNMLKRLYPGVVATSSEAKPEPAPQPTSEPTPLPEPVLPPTSEAETPAEPAEPADPTQPSQPAEPTTPATSVVPTTTSSKPVVTTPAPAKPEPTLILPTKRPTAPTTAEKPKPTTQTSTSKPTSTTPTTAQQPKPTQVESTTNAPEPVVPPKPKQNPFDVFVALGTVAGLMTALVKLLQQSGLLRF